VRREVFLHPTIAIAQKNLEEVAGNKAADGFKAVDNSNHFRASEIQFEVRLTMDGKFYTIQRSDRVVRRSWGYVDCCGSERFDWHATVAEAEAEAQRLLRRKLAQGFLADNLEAVQTAQTNVCVEDLQLDNRSGGNRFQRGDQVGNDHPAGDFKRCMMGYVIRSDFQGKRAHVVPWDPEIPPGWIDWKDLFMHETIEEFILRQRRGEQTPGGRKGMTIGKESPQVRETLLKKLKARLTAHRLELEKVESFNQGQLARHTKQFAKYWASGKGCDAPVVTAQSLDDHTDELDSLIRLWDNSSDENVDMDTETMDRLFKKKKPATTQYAWTYDTTTAPVSTSDEDWEDEDEEEYDEDEDE